MWIINSEVYFGKVPRAPSSEGHCVQTDRQREGGRERGSDGEGERDREIERRGNEVRERGKCFTSARTRVRALCAAMSHNWRLLFDRMIKPSEPGQEGGEESKLIKKAEGRMHPSPCRMYILGAVAKESKPHQPMIVIAAFQFASSVQSEAGVACVSDNAYKQQRVAVAKESREGGWGGAY